MSSNDPLLAIIDQGSSATKGGVYTSGGRCLQALSAPVQRWIDGAAVEHDAAALADSVVDLLDRLIASHPVTAVALTCQRSTCLVWGRNTGAPLGRALSWQDRSELPRIRELAPEASSVAERTGLLLSPHYAAPKLSRLLRELPDGLARASAGEVVAGTLDAFLVRQLTGRDATEGGQAGRTLLYNLDTDDWDPYLCDLFGIPQVALPELSNSAGQWGEWRGLPLAAVAGDQQAALLGHGGWQEGCSVAHFGTGAFVLSSTGGRLRRHPGLLSAVLASFSNRRRFQLEGAVNSAGSAVDWACRLTGQRIEDWSQRPLEPLRGPWILPAFAGLGAPWWQAEAQATVAGLRLDATGEDLLEGVLVGLAMRVLDCTEALAEAGATQSTLRLSGKLTRVRGLVDLIADAGQIAVEVSAEEDTGMAGLARLAAAGLSGDEAALFEIPAAEYRREPRWSKQQADDLRGKWRQFVLSCLPRERIDGLES